MSEVHLTPEALDGLDALAGEALATAEALDDVADMGAVRALVEKVTALTAATRHPLTPTWPATGVVRLSVNLAPSTANALHEMMTGEQVSATEAVRLCIRDRRDTADLRAQVAAVTALLDDAPADPSPIEPQYTPVVSKASLRTALGLSRPAAPAPRPLRINGEKVEEILWGDNEMDARADHHDDGWGKCQDCGQAWPCPGSTR